MTDTAITRCACGARVLDSFIGTYSDHEYTHTRKVCSPNTVTLGNAADVERANREAALIRFAREVLRAPCSTDVREAAIEHGLAEYVPVGTTHEWRVKPGVLE